MGQYASGKEVEDEGEPYLEAVLTSGVCHFPAEGRTVYVYIRVKRVGPAQ